MSGICYCKLCVSVLLCDGVDTGLHHRQAFTAFYIVWKLLDTCKRATQRGKGTCGCISLHVLLSFSAGKLSQIVILTAFHELESLKTFLFVFWFVRVICVTERIFTVFTDVQLFEVNQAGDGGGQVGQVVIGHAQLLQGLAVEELLWEHKGGKETMQYYSLSAEIKQTFSGKVQKDREHKVSWRHAPLNVVEKQCHLSSAFI